MTKNQEVYLEQQKVYLEQLINSNSYHKNTIANLEGNIKLDTENLELSKKRLSLNEWQIESTKTQIADLESNEEYECVEELELADNSKFEKGRTFFKSALAGFDKSLIEKHFVKK